MKILGIDNNSYIDNKDYSNFIALSRYARWIPENNSRETWYETVERYVNYWYNKGLIDEPLKNELFLAIYNLDVMPSMRALMTAGKALDRDECAGFNCSFLAINRVRAFDEILYILACGVGVGFSCERQEISHLPEIPELMTNIDTILHVRDSKIGWATAFKELISLLYEGSIPKWNISKVRPAGSVLKTFGGRASGPEPLVDLFNYTISLFKKASGRKLNSIEVHGLVCKIAEIVVVGGVRRSALISLSNLSDDRMRHAKSGSWWEHNPEYALSNNSVAYTEKPDIQSFIREWSALIESKSGERGIFNRVGAIKHAASNGRRDASKIKGVNPCSEILMRDCGFCNLSEVIVRENDTVESLERKVRLATILGTLQSTLTNYRYLSKMWSTNSEEERLLGVSLTGIMDCDLTNHIYDDLPSILTQLKNVAIDTNKVYSDKFGISQSVSVTCVKPSGTVSQLCNTSSGIHARFSDYYIRTVRADMKDPLCKFMKDYGFPCEPDVMKSNSTMVFSFPIKSPKNSVKVKDLSAIEQLKLWKIYKDNWAEHTVSVTIYVKDHEWLEVGAWVYKNFDSITGISFLPYSDHTYQQAPYQECDEEYYLKFLDKMPKGINWNNLSKYESEDNTISSQNFACSGGVCEIVDIIN